MCLEGDENGPFEDIPCPSWNYATEQCPIIPNCIEYNNCGSCANQESCAWCASSNVCMTVSEAFSSQDCQGLVFEPPCPNSFSAGNNCLWDKLVYNSYARCMFRKRDCWQPLRQGRSHFWRRRVECDRYYYCHSPEHTIIIIFLTMHQVCQQAKREMSSTSSSY